MLVSEWINGKKLTSSEPDEIRRLSRVGSEAFLTQLLDIGMFHGDPHGGNLLATEDGKLCILDFGLVAEVPRKDRDTIVSSIIHLANRDFPQVVNDLVDLGFLPASTDKPLVADVTKRVLGPYVTKGGGAKNLNVTSLMKDMTSALLQIEFSIPPEYALIGRALVTLEGIALSGDPNFKMVMEAYPFVANRVMAESDSPALQKALNEILYRSDGTFSPTRLFALVSAAMGRVSKDSDAFVTLDNIPKGEGVTLEDFVHFILGDQASSVREVLLPEVINALDLFIRKQSGLITQDLRRLPLLNPFLLSTLDRAENSFKLTPNEELYLRSLIELASELLEVEKADLSNPLFTTKALTQSLLFKPPPTLSFATGEIHSLWSIGGQVTEELLKRTLKRIASLSTI